MNSLKTSLILGFALSGLTLFCQNPISPPGVYIADPSAHVWKDGRIYIYGSLDENCNFWCSPYHHILVSDDLKKWSLVRNAFASKGEGDEVPYNDNLLFAPDAAYANNTYYLYYCQPDMQNAEGVAVSDNPAGPFRNGKALSLKGYNQIDPSLFIDDDGQAYYIWGQFTLKMAKMKPGMTELDLSSVSDSVLTEKSHHFHEGAFMAKRNGIYYLVYADISRGDTPTCIGYSTSRSPFGPYEYGGVIIDNNYCNPGNWNNHGSIAEFKGRWYVFYHRSTHGCKIMRKTCMEPINFSPDGSITEVEMTSQGAGGPLPATSRIEAEWACLLNGNVRAEYFSGTGEILNRIRSGDRICYKYIDFSMPYDSLSIRLLQGKGQGGKISVYTDQQWSRKIGEFTLKASDEGDEWRIITAKIEKCEGVHALWFTSDGDEKLSLSLDWITFK